jgi:ketosteroid isomerase-like protein
MESLETVRNFIACINLHDAGDVAALMTEDHAFTDSLGQVAQGRERMRQGWWGYYALCPDYWISCDEFFVSGDRVAVFGAAGGTIALDGALSPENKWSTPAAWLAVVEGGFVKEWRVYADNKPVYDILAKSNQAR